jgi:uncharacterized protein YndB with AHSA1/START domain
MLANRIECATLVEAPVERAWSVLTEPRHVIRWHAFGGAEIDLRPFGTLTFRWQERGCFHGIIATFEPPYAISYLCTCLSPGERPRVGNSTLVELTVEPVGHMTRICVAESGFAQLHVTETLKLVLAASSRRAWSAGLDLVRQIAEQTIPATTR